MECDGGRCGCWAYAAERPGFSIVEVLFIHILCSRRKILAVPHISSALRRGGHLVGIEQIWRRAPQITRWQDARYRQQFAPPKITSLGILWRNMVSARTWIHNRTTGHPAGHTSWVPYVLSRLLTPYSDGDHITPQDAQAYALGRFRVYIFTWQGAGGVLLCFIDLRVRRIGNEASSCPGIFSRTLLFYYVSSSPVCGTGPLIVHFFLSFFIPTKQTFFQFWRKFECMPGPPKNGLIALW